MCPELRRLTDFVLLVPTQIDEPPTEEHFRLRWEKEVGEDFKHEVDMRLLEVRNRLPSSVPEAECHLLRDTSCSRRSTLRPPRRGRVQVAPAA